MLSQHLAHHLADDFRQGLCQIINLVAQTAELGIEVVGKPVHFVLNTIQTCFDSGKIVAIAAGLFENMARDHFLAFDLALDEPNTRFELFPDYICRHRSAS